MGKNDTKVVAVLHDPFLCGVYQRGISVMVSSPTSALRASCVLSTVLSMLDVCCLVRGADSTVKFCHDDPHK